MADRIANTGAEAPASLTVRFRVHGLDTMLTLRSDSGGDLLRKLPIVIREIELLTGTPHNGDVSNGPVDAGSNGHSQVCALHGVEMSQHSKNGHAWYSHRLDDGTWCKGNPHGGGQ